jgi:hypothetical protein
VIFATGCSRDVDVNDKEKFLKEANVYLVNLEKSYQSFDKQSGKTYKFKIKSIGTYKVGIDEYWQVVAYPEFNSAQEFYVYQFREAKEKEISIGDNYLHVWKGKDKNDGYYINKWKDIKAIEHFKDN